MSATPGDRPPIAVVGAGYVGLVTAVGFARLGHDVYCIEADPVRLDLLAQGEIPFFEPGLPEALAEHRSRLHFSRDYDDAVAHCRLFLIAVGTPTSDTGEADVSAVWSVMDEIPLTADHAVVMKSTVPPGTGVQCRARLDRRGLHDVVYVSCPEFLRESTGLSDFANPDRVVIGDDGTWAGDAVASLYAPLIDPDRVIRTDATTAETLKLAANAFLTARISFINEIANLCDGVGADVTAAAAAIGLDPRIGPHFLQAGIGFGGSCFGKDLKSLAYECRRAGVGTAMVDAILAVNDHQWERVLDKARRHLGDLGGTTVALLGLSFKPGTSNVRDATSIPLLAGLLDAGVHVRACDPKADRAAVGREPGLVGRSLDDVHFTTSADDALADAEVAVLVTEWPEFLALDWHDVSRRMAGSLVIDGRNVLDPGTVTEAGLIYEGIGRSVPAAPTSPDRRPA